MSDDDLRNKFEKWFNDTNQEINDELDYEETKNDAFEDFSAGYRLAKSEIMPAISQIKYLIRLLELEGLETRAEYFDAKELLEKLAKDN